MVGETWTGGIFEWTEIGNAVENWRGGGKNRDSRNGKIESVR